jgi:hypothetical protein
VGAPPAPREDLLEAADFEEKHETASVEGDRLLTARRPHLARVSARSGPSRMEVVDYEKTREVLSAFEYTAEIHEGVARPRGFEPLTYRFVARSDEGSETVRT